MRKSVGSFVVVAVVILGFTLAANADSQSILLSGPGGQQTLTINTNLDFLHLNSGYSFALSGATGSTSGSCSWLSKCLVTAIFNTTVAGITYQETAVEQGQWSLWGWTWSNSSFSSTRVQVPEASSLLELMMVALALVLIVPRAAKLRRVVQA
jgi:hypothetical protein